MIHPGRCSSGWRGVQPHPIEAQIEAPNASQRPKTPNFLSNAFIVNSFMLVTANIFGGPKLVLHTFLTWLCSLCESQGWLQMGGRSVRQLSLRERARFRGEAVHESPSAWESRQAMSLPSGRRRFFFVH